MNAKEWNAKKDTVTFKGDETKISEEKVNTCCVKPNQPKRKPKKKRKVKPNLTNNNNNQNIST